jgi:hypothetical protein
MTPDLRELELEQLRDEIERHRIVLVEAYKIRKWLDCENIREERLLEFLKILSNGDSGYPWNSAQAEYRSDSNGFGRIAVMLPSKVTSKAKLYTQVLAPKRPVINIGDSE